MDEPQVIVISGSNRTGSLHRSLADLAAGGLASQQLRTTPIDLADYPLPLFDPDLLAESGPPAAAHELRAIIGDHQGIVLASPEYNGAMTPLVKNTVDWISRVDMFTFFGKCFGLMAASPGRGGGAKVLAMTDMWLTSIGALVHSETFSLPTANEHLVDGRLDEETARRLDGFCESYATWVRQKVAEAAQQAVN